eukprot:TRINITY_DN17623_c0_g1_i3.p1 TRINITY_DN17623_c0_g1~~TRINITY_DN17623_c0_g1_i3.p1  ORF type:complete len:144 (+),score=8.89 TRINITY_DN17623_c0_g1_i3:230-661(+)
MSTPFVNPPHSYTQFLDSTPGVLAVDYYFSRLHGRGKSTPSTERASRMAAYRVDLPRNPEAMAEVAPVVHAAGSGLRATYAVRPQIRVAAWQTDKSPRSREERNEEIDTALKLRQVLREIDAEALTSQLILEGAHEQRRRRPR